MNIFKKLNCELAKLPETEKIKLLISYAEKSLDYSLFAAKYYAEFGLRLTEKFDNNEKKTATLLLAHCNRILSIIHSKLQQFDIALEYAYKAEESYLKVNETSGLAYSYNNIGSIFLALNDFEKALHFHHKALTINKKNNCQKEVADSYNNIGNVYLHLSDYKNSLKYHEISLNIRKGIPDKIGLASSYNNLAILFMFKNLFGEALKNYQKAHEIFSDLGKNQQFVTVLNNIGKCYLKLEKYDESLQYFKQALLLSKELEMVSLQLSVTKSLSNYYRKIGNDSMQIEYLNEIILLKDKIFQEDKKNQILELQFKHRIEKKEKEAEIFKLKNIELKSALEKLQKSYEELKESQEDVIALETKNSALAMAVTANHELNQPLMIIQGNIELLQILLKNKIDKKIEKYFGNIESSVERMGRILQKFANANDISIQKYQENIDMVIFE